MKDTRVAVLVLTAMLLVSGCVGQNDDPLGAYEAGAFEGGD